MIKKHAQRFEELQKELERIVTTRHKKRWGDLSIELDMVDGEALSEWKVKVKSLLVICCGSESVHYKEFTQRCQRQ